MAVVAVGLVAGSSIADRGDAEIAAAGGSDEAPAVAGGESASGRLAPAPRPESFTEAPGSTSDDGGSGEPTDGGPSGYASPETGLDDETERWRTASSLEQASVEAAALAAATTTTQPEPTTTTTEPVSTTTSAPPAPEDPGSTAPEPEPAPTDASHPEGWVDAGHGVFVPPVLLEIRYCESRDNYQAANPSSSARGAYQFTSGSWAAYGHAERYGVSSADQASNAQQDEAAVLTWERDGTRPWNASNHCWG